MSTPKQSNGVDLPTWTDAASVASYLTSVIGAVVAVITLTHPGFVEPTLVQALVAPVSLLVAGVAQFVNIVWHRKATIAAIQAAGFVAAQGYAPH